MLLSLAPPGVPLIIDFIEEMDLSQRKQLSNLGIIQDSEVEIVTRDRAGVILMVKGSRIGIAKDMAKMIRVSIKSG
ncbi:MAG: ferrous iron transport protein A [Tissierellia bacterium]|nr:ferrous iron transport protein A [Tissierellia bacterium]